MDIHELKNEVDTMVDNFLEDNMRRMTGEQAEYSGLDRRATYGLFFNEDAIAVRGNTRQLDYYGGFEYIEDDYKYSIGDVTVYLREHNRVDEVLSRLFDGDIELG